MEYYNVNRILNEKSMPINQSLLKHSYQNFSLTILEFCNIDSLVSREKHFFDVYSPEYNILNIPGSPSRGSGWKHSEATIENMRTAASKTFKSPEFLTKLSKGQSSGIKVEVTDLITNTYLPCSIEVTNVQTNEVLNYSSISSAGEALDISQSSISVYLSLKKNIFFFYKKYAS